MSVKPLRDHKSALFTIIIVLIAVTPQAINMFGYPFYHQDEGTYMAQAYSLVTQGQLAPYTYWYDHSPVGWAQIGIWAVLTGGFHTFGFSINSGRAFMLVLHGLSTLLLIGICRKVFKSSIPILIAVVVFSFSPLAIENQRRVLLDNIMTFWMLASLFLVLGEKRKLIHYVGSAIAFGLAFLSKESMIYVLPGMLLVVYMTARSYRTRFPFILWIMLMGIVIAYYPLYALLQGEFFPAGSLLGGDNAHVSLLESVSFQNGRTGGFFMYPDSGFMNNWRGWNKADPKLMIMGVFATAFVVLISIRKVETRPIALLTICYWAFLIRGGIVLGFYLLPLIPLLALCIGASFHYTIIFFVRAVKNIPLRATLSMAGVSLAVLPFLYTGFSPLPLYWLNQTDNQIQVIRYIQKHVSPNAFIAIDMYAFIELRETMPKAHYYWKVDRDPAISVGLLHNDWCNIDYLLVTRDLIGDAAGEHLQLTEISYEHSRILTARYGTYWDVLVRKVDKTFCFSAQMAHHLTVIAN